MDGKSLLNHQERLEVVFRLKTQQLRDVILGKYKATSKDIINLVSDLIEISEIFKSIEQKKERYLK